MRKFIFLFSFYFLGTALQSGAQHQEVGEQASLWRGRQNQTDDSTSLLYAFKKGQVHGHFRYYFSATDNKTGLSDYYAHAIGGGIKFETARFHGFQLGVSGFFVYNIGSSNLTLKDPQTNQLSRYELGLFDITDPANRSDIDRLDELYLKYSWKNSQVSFGKQHINTPFINLQDGRMRTTDVGGIYADIHEVKNTRIEGGFLYEISPRSTVEWYKIGESIGLYPQGVAPSGARSDYGGNLESKGIALLGITHRYKERLTTKFYNIWVENIFNSVLLQTDLSVPDKKKGNWQFGAQLIRQDALGNGGNEDPAKAYMQKGTASLSFGFKAGYEKKRWNASLNFNRITARGRYLMPREWGRDPFYTFLARERNEGFGDLNAWVARGEYRFPRIRSRVSIGFGYYDLPDVQNYALNKYGLPSYTQLNIDMRHSFDGFLKGLEAQLLFVYKGKAGAAYGNPGFIINKVDMGLWNLVFNYHF